MLGKLFHFHLKHKSGNQGILHRREFQRERKKIRKRQSRKESQIQSGSFLDKITPRSGYKFYSNYFKINSDCWATILTVFHPQGSDRHLGPMWGISLLPQHLPAGTNARLLTNMNAMPHDEWVVPHLKNLENIVKMTTSNSIEAGEYGEMAKSNYRKYDAIRINHDLLNGDSYFSVSFKILMKAVSRKKLIQGMHYLKNYYDSCFKNQIYLASFDGEQYEDLRNLYKPGSYQIGHNFQFTSTELAGEYNLVTQGIDDPKGDYCGVMRGDINQAPVIWDMDDFRTHAIIAADQPAMTSTLTRHPSWLKDNFPRDTRGSALWSTKLSQQVLTNGHRVVHLVLDGSPISKIGLDPSEYTIDVDMNQGVINPMEFFGPIYHHKDGTPYVTKQDQETAIPRHYNKLRMMAKQIMPTLHSYDLQKNFHDALDFFYEHEEMLVPDYEHHTDALRIFIPNHKTVPRIKDFVLELQVMIDSSIIGKDLDKKHSLMRIQAVFRENMAKENGPIFNQWTDPILDNVHSAGQVIYDFTKLRNRGRGVMMAQLINVLAYAISNLKHGDLLVIDGAEGLQSETPQATKELKDYVANAIVNLENKDVRVVYTYDSVDKMLDDTAFNHFSDADYVLTGHMSKPLILKYEKELGHQRLPATLISEVQYKSDLLYYLRRDNNNILFEANPFVCPLIK